MDAMVDSTSPSVSRGGKQIIPRPELWTPGRPAPWATIERPSGLVVPDRARLAVPPERKGLESPVKKRGATLSAVLVPMYERDGETRIVLTRRSWNMRTHRGEVSFPGGRADPGETPLQAALREAHEEIGLPASAVEPLGELDHLTTVTRRSYIVPIVGIIEVPPEFVLSPDEVDAVIDVNVDELLAPGVFREERWGIGEESRPVFFFDIEGDTIWGATAAMLRQLLARLTDTDPGEPIDLDPARGVEIMHYDIDPLGHGGVA